MFMNESEEQPGSRVRAPTSASLCLISVGWAARSLGLAGGDVGFPVCSGRGAAASPNVEWGQGLPGCVEETPRIGIGVPLFVSLILGGLFREDLGKGLRETHRHSEQPLLGASRKSGISQLLLIPMESSHQQRLAGAMESRG